MYKVIYRTTRENKLVHFYPRPDSVQNVINNEKAAGRLLHESTGFSEDYLVKRYIAIWKDRQDLENFNKIPEVQAFVRKKKFYDQENNHFTNVIGEYLDE